MEHKKIITIGDKTITLTTGKIAKQADAAVLVQCGETVVLVTAVASKQGREGADFMPLTVELEERMYAAGKIPGGWFKREGRPTEKATLTARLIDRPLRPCFPKGFYCDTQIVATILSVDHMNAPDVLSVLGASAALTLSDIPFEGPVGCARVSRVNGSWVANPTFQEVDESDLEVTVGGIKGSLLMIESGADEVSEQDIVAALAEAQKHIDAQVQTLNEWRAEIGTPKREFVPALVDERIKDGVKRLSEGRLKEALTISEKADREDAIGKIREETIAAIIQEFSERFAEEQKPLQENAIKTEIKALEKSLMRAAVLGEGRRIDGRGTKDIRQIDSEISVLPRTHGTGLFTRGQTQVLSILTLGALGEEQRMDSIDVEESKRFLHHYNFPPFSVGEAGRMTGPKRREIGHGALVERALLKVIPDAAVFPYTIRLVAEVLESNGSSSMASVCAGTLAMMDAGVPIKAPVTGIAMGLIQEGDKYAILTDILGAEDALGDMDFKVAGTQAGITALQLDNKSAGLSLAILEEALAQAKEARLFILNKVLETIPEPKQILSQYAPRVFAMKVDPDKIRVVIGPGGKMIRSIMETTNSTVDVEDDGTILITARTQAGADEARKMIDAITKPVSVGDTFNGRVVKIANFGAFVNLAPGTDGLVHKSRLGVRVVNVEDVMNVGDTVEVEVVGIDSLGRVDLQAKGLQQPEGVPEYAEREQRFGRDRGDGGGRDRGPGGGGGGGYRR